MESTEPTKQQEKLVETQIEELKVTEGPESNNDFEPWLGLQDALEEIGMDWKSPDFKEEDMIKVL
jgi:hypothetical protein